MSVKAEIKGGNLIITIPVNQEGTPSASGKTLVHASTRGNAVTKVMIGDKPLVIGLNAYTKK